MSTIVLKDVCKSFGDLEVLHHIDLDIRDHEFTVFVGPSGCGKSTLLRLICGLDEITSGEMTIDGERVNDVPPAKRGIAMVFQSYALYPHMTVAQNMGYALRLAKYPADEIRRRVDAAAGILKIRDYLDRKPRALSGGQRQRVAIGRAIVREPRVFLFDEPLSNLDAALRVEMRVEIAKLRADLNATMVYVTHDQTEAMTMADRIVVLRDGRVEQVGSPLEIYHHPENRFVAGFIGSPKMNFLDATLTEINGTRAVVSLPGGASVTVPANAGSASTGAKVVLGVRPEHLIEGGGGDSEITGRVIVVEHLGGDTLAHMEVDGQENRIMVRTTGDSRVKAGDPLRVGMESVVCHLFDDGERAFPRLV